MGLRTRVAHESIDVLEQVVLGDVELVEGDVDLEVALRERHVLVHLQRRRAAGERSGSVLA